MTETSGHIVELLLLKGLESMLVPPGLYCVLILCSLIFYPHKFSVVLLLFTGVLIYLTALSATQEWLAGILGNPVLSPVAANRSQAIVVLGGGRHLETPDYGGDTVNHLTLERLRYAALIQRQTGLPILVSGGKPFRGTLSEAQLMRDILNKEFLGKVEWTETESRTTYENAEYSAAILKKHGIRKILLITHAYHMPRAKEAFEFVGLNVTPAATIFFTRKPETLSYFRWIPSISASYWNHLMLHELVGRLWYHLRYYRTFTRWSDFFT